MGDSLEEATENVEEALRDYALETDRDGLALIPPSASGHVEVPAGCTFTHVTLARSSTRA